MKTATIEDLFLGMPALWEREFRPVAAANPAKEGEAAVDHLLRVGILWADGVLALNEAAHARNLAKIAALTIQHRAAFDAEEADLKKRYAAFLAQKKASYHRRIFASLPSLWESLQRVVAEEIATARTLGEKDVADKRAAFEEAITTQEAAAIASCMAEIEKERQQVASFRLEIQKQHAEATGGAALPALFTSFGATGDVRGGLS